MNLLRFGLCALYAGSVLALGGVDVWSRSLIEIAAAALFVVWAFVIAMNPDARIQWSPLNWPLLGLIAIGLFQIVCHTTASAFLTRTQLLRLATYLLVFFLTTQAFRTRDELTKLAWFLVALCFAVSLLGIIQDFTSSREIYWSEAFQTEGESFGPYVNRNHFAGFVELTLPLGLAMIAFRGVRRQLLPLTALLTIVPISALVLSGSRGGIIGFAFEVGILALLAWSRRAPSWKSPRLIAAGVLALVVLATVAWVGADRAIERFSSIKSPEVALSRRASMAHGAARIFLDHPVLGSGVGTMVDVFPLYETAYDGKTIDHVHNDYMETLAESGIVGGFSCAMFLWLLLRQARKNFDSEQSHFSRALHAGAMAAIGGLLLHSLVDFNLQIPANALLFLLQAALALSLPFNSNSRAMRRT
jgi:O-antigen ligase